MKVLNELENESIYIIREAMARFKRPAVMWSSGKDSTTVLYLMKKATYSEMSVPVIHLDTTFKFKEIYKFRDKVAKEWKLNLIVAKNEKALKEGMNPKKGKFECCHSLKTENLKQVVKEHKFDALIFSIRRDEHHLRNMERVFSPRGKDFRWKFIRKKTKSEMKEGDSPFVSEQNPELWQLYQTEFGDDCGHVRVHPIMSWNELDVWRYIKREKIPVNPLYFSRNGKRYRSLGCEPCTTPIKSNAKNIDEIIEELKTTTISERSGRDQDKERLMRKLRALGYG